MCIVKACCKIRNRIWYKCDCKQYEFYMLYKYLLSYTRNEYLANLMLSNNRRMKQLNEKNKI
jgi:hypothetical protein